MGLLTSPTPGFHSLALEPEVRRTERNTVGILWEVWGNRRTFLITAGFDGALELRDSLGTIYTCKPHRLPRACDHRATWAVHITRTTLSGHWLHSNLHRE